MKNLFNHFSSYSKNTSKPTLSRIVDTTVEHTVQSAHTIDEFSHTSRRPKLISTNREQKRLLAKEQENRKKETRATLLSRKMNATSKALAKIEKAKLETKKDREQLEAKRLLRSKIATLIKNDNFFLCDAFCDKNVLI